MVDTSCELSEKVVNGSENSPQGNSFGVQENSCEVKENSCGVQEIENSCAAALHSSDSQEPPYERKSVLKQVTVAVAVTVNGICCTIFLVIKLSVHLPILSSKMVSFPVCSLTT